jgi:hypothetical protein
VWRRAGLVGLSPTLYSMVTIHFSKYLGSSTSKLLVKLSSRCYSFMGSSSVLVADTLVEGPDKEGIALRNARVVVDSINVVFRS